MVVEHKQTGQANQRPAVFFALSSNVNGMVIVLHSLSPAVMAGAAGIHWS